MALRSTFAGFNTAVTGLMVSQKRLDVVGHNIANVNTVGYTRQRIVTASIDPYGGNMRFAPTKDGNVGQGVRVQTLDQIRSVFLDRKYREQNSYTNEYTYRLDCLEFIETAFNEVTDAGISKSLANFMDAVQELSKNVELEANRTLLRSKAEELCLTLGIYYDQMVKEQTNQNEMVKANVSQINELAQSIAQINVQIHGYELGGEIANDLRDKRNVYLDQLSGLVDITYGNDPDGYLEVYIGDEILVHHKEFNTLVADPSITNPIAGEANLYAVKWGTIGTTKSAKGIPVSGRDVDITSGELKARMDLVSSDDPDHMGIPYIVHQLDVLAEALVREFNAVNKAGYTMPDISNGYTSNTGVDFFDPAGVTAKTIKISQAVKDSVFNIACSDGEVIMGSEGPPIVYAQNVGNNLNMLKMVALAQATDLTNVGNFEGFLRTFILEIATETGHTRKLQQTQDVVQYNLEEQRMSLSGVSLDEEMTLMIKFQHAYNAAARTITAMDEMLEKLINGTGIVGR